MVSVGKWEICIDLLGDFLVILGDYLINGDFLVIEWDTNGILMGF